MPLTKVPAREAKAWADHGERSFVLVVKSARERGSPFERIWHREMRPQTGEKRLLVDAMRS